MFKVSSTTEDRSTMHPKFNLNGIRTHDLQIMTVHFMSLRHLLEPLGHQWLTQIARTALPISIALAEQLRLSEKLTWNLCNLIIVIRVFPEWSVRANIRTMLKMSVRHSVTVNTDEAWSLVAPSWFSAVLVNECLLYCCHTGPVSITRQIPYVLRPLTLSLYLYAVRHL